MFEHDPMARKRRIQFVGAIYHVTMRGVERRAIFRHDADRERFMAQLAESIERFGVRLYGFCLMPNHVHLLVETPRANLSAFMHRLQTAYTVYFNRRHRRVGHLMQGRFAAKPVHGDAYLLQVSRYIHLNPVFTMAWISQPLPARRAALRVYPWSSYLSFIGLVKPLVGLEREPLLAMMPGAPPRRQSAYQRFVEEGLTKPDETVADLLHGSAWGIGDEAFQEKMKHAYLHIAASARRPEDISFRRAGTWNTADEVLEAVTHAFGVSRADMLVKGRHQAARPVAMRLLIQHAGMTQREVADLLHAGTGSAVCRAISRLMIRIEKDPSLASRMHSAVARLTRRDGAHKKS